MKKTIVYILVIAALILALSGCGDSMKDSGVQMTPRPEVTMKPQVSAMPDVNDGVRPRRDYRGRQRPHGNPCARNAQAPHHGGSQAQRKPGSLRKRPDASLRRACYYKRKQV